jgi:putative nucleotidyltransferase with HDIG domain
VKYEKLHENSLNTLFIHKDDIGKFRQYTVQTLSKYLSPNQMSETDRTDKLKTCVRDLISDIFIEDTTENTFSKSQSLLKEVKEVIQLLLNESNKDIMQKLNQMVNRESGFYQHLANVSAYAGVFAMVLEFENPEHMALAGILHDLGKVNIPPEFADLEVSQMGPHALEAYKNHPNYSLDVIKLKKLVIPEKVQKAIGQHHEAMNGSGFPANLEGHRISKEGRLLAIANAFDHLTSMQIGKKALSPAEALVQLHEENTKDPGRMILDAEMLRGLRIFLIK